MYTYKLKTKETIEELNELGVPENDKRSNGGLIPDRTTKYGNWLYRNDPTAFCCAKEDLNQRFWKP